MRNAAVWGLRFPFLKILVMLDSFLSLGSKSGLEVGSLASLAWCSNPLLPLIKVVMKEKSKAFSLRQNPQWHKSKGSYKTSACFHLDAIF